MILSSLRLWLKTEFRNLNSVGFQGSGGEDPQALEPI